MMKCLQLGEGRLHPINHSWIILLAKKVGAQAINDYRPISLANCSYKLFSKLLANRLSGKLDELVNKSQSAFIEGRHIQSSVAIASEVLFHLKENNQEGVMFKLDFEKAFDNLDWDFLLDTLNAKNFSNNWIRWVKMCLESSYASCLINGKEGNSFKVRRGLKQGCPLSPMLFILAVDALDAIIRRASEIGLLLGTGPEGIWQVINLYFADDTLFFCQVKPDQILVLKTILLCFEAASGLKINLQKSSMYYLGDNLQKGEELAKLMQCTNSELPFSYLGLPVMNKKLPKEIWRSVIEKVKKRLLSWKSNFLSQAGRLVLVNSVLSSIPSYIMSFYLLPKWVLKEIEKIRRNFFWKGKSEEKKMMNVSWSIICKPKSAGGLGVLDLSVFNKALLGKWLWSLLSEDQPLWGQVVMYRYFRRKRVFNLKGKKGGKVSNQWKGIQKISEAFRAGIHFEAGAGTQISFWKDL